MITVTLHEATDADLPTALAILHVAFEEYRTMLDPPSGVHAETVERLREKTQNGRIVLASAQTNVEEQNLSNGDPVSEHNSVVSRRSSVVGSVVGCVFYERRDGYIYLGRLAILPAYRGRGIAHMLIGYVEERARNAGLARVRLGVRTALPHMRVSYERMGYRLVEELAHPGYERPTYVILEKNVST